MAHRRSPGPARAGFLLAALPFLVSVDAAAQGTAAAVHQHAHVHGMAKLGVAMQGKTVSISLESPLDSLIGFEHWPTTTAEKAAVDALQARIRAPQDLFSFNPEARCSLVKSNAESAIFGAPPAEGVAEAHADLDASFEFSCAEPDKLAALELSLFRIYPKLHKLDVDVATEKGQFKRNLTSPAHTIALTR